MRQLRSGVVLVFLLGAVLAVYGPGQRLHDTAALECRDYTTPDWRGRPFAIRFERDLVAPELGTRPARLHDRYSTECTGHLLIVPADTQTFVLSSDDGSELRIDDADVILNGGQHVMTTATGAVALGAGPHPLRIRYAQEGGATRCVRRFPLPG